MMHGEDEQDRSSQDKGPHSLKHNEGGGGGHQSPGFPQNPNFASLHPSPQCAVYFFILMTPRVGGLSSALHSASMCHQQLSMESLPLLRGSAPSSSRRTSCRSYGARLTSPQTPRHQAGIGSPTFTQPATRWTTSQRGWSASTSVALMEPRRPTTSGLPRRLTRSG